MRRAGRITAQARALAGSMVAPGVTTHEIDTAVRRFIESHGAKPSFLGYGGFPGSACISVNDEVIHGIPGPRKLKEGDIVSVDVGAFIGGFHGDCAATYACGQISDEAKQLIEVTQQSFWEGIKMARQGCRVSDIGHAVQAVCGGQRLLCGPGLCGPRCGRKAPRGPGGTQFRPRRPRPPAAARHDPGGGAHGQCGRLAGPGAARTAGPSKRWTALWPPTMKIPSSSPKVTPRSSPSPRMEPMFDYTGQIVQATAGRDKGGVFCVVAMDQRQERLLLADGKRRKVSRPKAKKLGHVRQLTEVRQEYDHPAIHKLRQGEPVSDRELRRALAAFKEGITLGER